MGCRYCGETREVEFYKSNKTTCKSCIIKRSKLWAQEHPDRVKQIDKRKRELHKESISKYYREWYAKGGRARADGYCSVIMAWAKNHKTERAASRKLRNAVERGILERPLYCSLCSRKASIQAHHSDYNEPLDVIWVCASCHKKLHPKERNPK